MNRLCRCGCSLDQHPIQPGGTSNCVRCPGCVCFAVPGTRAAREAEQSERDKEMAVPPSIGPIDRGRVSGRADREYYPEEDDDLGLSATGLRWQQEEEQHQEAIR